MLGAQRRPYAGRRVLVVGSGHSAFNALLDLGTLAEEAPGTAITWAIRRAAAHGLYGGGEADALPARGLPGRRLRELVERGAIRLVTSFRVTEVRRTAAGIAAIGETGATVTADEIIATTGFRPDLSLAAELRLALDPVVEGPVALAQLIDPNAHSCGTVPPHGAAELAHPELGFFTVGMNSYRRAPTFLLLTGYEQVRSVIAALVGDVQAAREVMLTLPQTGVCGGPVESSQSSSGEDAVAFGDPSSIAATPVENIDAGCCGGPASVASGACCALDAEAKAVGRSGCGCAATHHYDESHPPKVATQQLQVRRRRLGEWP